MLFKERNEEGKDLIFYSKCKNDELIFGSEKINSQINIRISKVPLEDIIFYKYESPIRSLDEIKHHLVKKIYSCEDFEKYIKAHKDEKYIYFSFYPSSNDTILYYALLITKYNEDDLYLLEDKPYLYIYHEKIKLVGMYYQEEYYSGCSYPNLFFKTKNDKLSQYYELSKLRFFEHKLDSKNIDLHQATASNVGFFKHKLYDEPINSMSHSPKMEKREPSNDFEMKDLSEKNYTDSTF